MRKILSSTTAICMLSLILSCSSGKKEERKDNTRVLMENTTDSQGIQRMQVSNYSGTVEHNGKNYTITLSRVPDDDLPMVKSEVGDMFVDNKITLHITHDSKDIFHKIFTKQDFNSIVGSEFLEKSILEGMVFAEENPQGLVFAVGVSYPQTDLFFPISVTISGNGKMNMKKAEVTEEFFYEE